MGRSPGQPSHGSWAKANTDWQMDRSGSSRSEDLSPQPAARSAPACIVRLTLALTTSTVHMMAASTRNFIELSLYIKSAVLSLLFSGSRMGLLHWPATSDCWTFDAALVR